MGAPGAPHTVAFWSAPSPGRVLSGSVRKNHPRSGSLRGSPELIGLRPRNCFLVTADRPVAIRAKAHRTEGEVSEVVTERSERTASSIARLGASLNGEWPALLRCHPPSLPRTYSHSPSNQDNHCLGPPPVLTFQHFRSAPAAQTLLVIKDCALHAATSIQRPSGTVHIGHCEHQAAKS